MRYYIGLKVHEVVDGQEVFMWFVLFDDSSFTEGANKVIGLHGLSTFVLSYKLSYNGLGCENKIHHFVNCRYCRHYQNHYPIMSTSPSTCTRRLSIYIITYMYAGDDWSTLEIRPLNHPLGIEFRSLSLLIHNYMIH